MSQKEGEGKRVCQGDFLHAVFDFAGKDFQDLSKSPSWFLKDGEVKKKKVVHKLLVTNTLEGNHSLE